jgi:hypothetical protein
MSHTSVTTPNFYRVLAQHGKRMKEVQITVTSMEGSVSLIDARDEVFVQAKGSVNGEIKEIEEEIQHVHKVREHFKLFIAQELQIIQTSYTFHLEEKL